MNSPDSDKLFAEAHTTYKTTMKPHVAILAAVLVAILINLAPVLSLLNGRIAITNTGMITSFSPLHIEGKYVKDIQNRTVFLRGVNRPSGFTSACTGAWFQNGEWPYGYSYTHWDETGLRQRLAQMQSLGFNVIRCIMFAQWWIQNSSTNLDGQATDKPFQYCFKETVRIAQEYGMYIVICPWAIDQGDPTELPFPTTSIPNQAAFVNFWVDVSNKLKQYPNIIYELYNEPAGNQGTWFNAVNATIQGIRNNGDSHIIIVQYGYCGEFDWVNDARIQGTNILYSNHIYRYPAGNTMPATTSYDDYNEINATLRSTWGYTTALNSGKALWIGEIGAATGVSNSTSETTYFRNALQLLNDWGMGYAAWNWDQPGSGWDLQSAPGDAPYLPNQRGQILVDAIANGRP